MSRQFYRDSLQPFSRVVWMHLISSHFFLMYFFSTALDKYSWDHSGPFSYSILKMPFPKLLELFFFLGRKETHSSSIVRLGRAGVIYRSEIPPVLHLGKTHWREKAEKATVLNESAKTASLCGQSSSSTFYAWLIWDRTFFKLIHIT